MKEHARIFIVDDHPLVRLGLTELFSRESDLAVCGEAEDRASALEHIQRTSPDLVLVDLSLRNSSGLELIKDLRAQLPRVLTMVLSMNEHAQVAVSALRAGARGYVDKQEPLPALLSAIRCILQGKRYVTPRFASQVTDALLQGNCDGHLSDRERQILTLLAHGRATPDIALALHLSVSTVQSYIERLKVKLGMHTDRELVAEAAHRIA